MLISSLPVLYQLKLIHLPFELVAASYRYYCFHNLAVNTDRFDLNLMLCQKTGEKWTANLLLVGIDRMSIPSKPYLSWTFLQIICRTIRVSSKMIGNPYKHRVRMFAGKKTFWRLKRFLLLMTTSLTSKS